MKRLTLLIIVVVLSQINIIFAQLSENEKKEQFRRKILEKTDTIALRQLSIQISNEYQQKKLKAIEWAKRNGFPIKMNYPDGKTIELQWLDSEGRPVYYTTYNEIAARTVSTDKVKPGGSLGLNLDGAGRTLAIWDGGSVYDLHSSFKETQVGPFHVFYSDTAEQQYNNHATHVAGTIVADGDEPRTKGMAEKSIVNSFDWNNDLAEMTEQANPPTGEPLTLSNHSYGKDEGWEKQGNDWYWYGNDLFSSDDDFGKYDSLAWNLDKLSHLAPYYTIVWAASNERGEGPETQPIQHYVWNGTSWVKSTNYREKDGGDDGFNCIPHQGIAKNIITVGAIDDIPNGYQQVSDVKQDNTSFSSWGPTNDGRIKPDIVANGDELYSTVVNMDADTTKPKGDYFFSFSGTSQATPNVTGSLVLLQQHYYQTHNQNPILSATLKALVVHTADEAGDNPGPDFKYGWGLLNTSKAAQVISLDITKGNTIQELTLKNNQTYNLEGIYNNGMEPLKVTIVWNDPASSNLQTDVLVNDLDLRIIGPDGTHSPWVLNANSPSESAITGDNKDDNVEQVLISNPIAGEYKISVTHKGNLSQGYDQSFSMIITGTSNPQTDVSIKQIDESGKAFGQAAFWNSTFWDFVDTNEVVTFGFDTQYFLSTYEFKPSTTQKFNFWEDNLITKNIRYRNWDTISIKPGTTEIKSRFKSSSDATLRALLIESSNSNSSIKMSFKDPWLMIEGDPNYYQSPYGYRNLGLSAQFNEVENGVNNIGINSIYKGVFLNQTPDPNNPNKPYYSVRAQETQDINLGGSIGMRKFYFLNWAGSNVEYQNANALETGVVFKDANAVAEANYKGHLFTNSLTATSSNSQRKIVQSSTGKWAMVYESMGRVWISRSNDGINWDKELEVDPVYASLCKYPSIAVSGDVAFIVWQVIGWFGGNGWDIAYIFMRKFDLTNNTLGEINEITYFTPNTENFLATPVIDGEWQFNVNYDVKMIAWREPDGIKVKYYNYYEGWSPVGTVPGTNGNCYNPSIVNYNGGSYCLTWEDRNNYLIKYTDAGYSPGLGWNFNATAQISPTYWYDNLRPQISMVSGHKPTIVWTSYNNIVEGVSVHVRQKSGMGVNDTWGNITSFSHTSSEPIEPVIGDYSGLNKYDIAWNFGGKIYKASYNGSSWNGPNIISWAGGNGVNINKNTSYQLKALWKQPGGPIALANIGGTPPPLSKSTDRNDSTNSEVVYKINRHGLIELNNVLNNENNNGIIAFEMAGLNLIKTNGEEEDIEYSSINDINPLSSTSLTLQPSDNRLKFRGAIYGMGIKYDNNDIMKLNEPLFKVTINEKNSKKELKQIWSSQPIFISTAVNGTFGEFKEIEIPVNELSGKEIYINIEMIGKKKNITPLIVEDYLILSDSALQKDDIKNKMEDLQITEYKLMQNYPNPFNPNTTINYQIPIAGFVSLKVYDILGREVKTLVNEQQEKGVYNIELNMNDFSSGIYIYTIKTENFVESKKLLLLK